MRFFIAFFMIIAYNINEQESLLDLSALLLWVQTFNLSASLLWMWTFNLSTSQLKMRIVNFEGDKLFLISLFCYTMEDEKYRLLLNKEYQFCMDNAERIVDCYDLSTVRFPKNLLYTPTPVLCCQDIVCICININAVPLWIVFCQYRSHHITCPYPSISQLS